VGEQAFPQLGFNVDGTALGGNLAQPQKTRAQDYGAEQEKEQRTYLLKAPTTQKHPVNYLVQKDHLGDRGAGTQYSQNNRATQEDPGMLYLPQQLSIRCGHRSSSHSQQCTKSLRRHPVAKDEHALGCSRLAWPSRSRPALLKRRLRG
jgi:hypothetical protein